MQRERMPTILRWKKNKNKNLEGLTLLDIKIYYDAIVIRLCGY